MKYLQEVFIPFLPKLPNAMGWGRLNRFYESKKWTTHIAKHFIGKTPSEPLQYAIVILTRHSSVEPDRDNNFASVKPCLDALKKNGIIFDDKPKHLSLDCLWKKSGHKKIGIEIKIIERSEGEL